MLELTCLQCPKGCHLIVDETKKTVTGNLCHKGEKFGLAQIKVPQETTNNTKSSIKREFSSTVKIKHARYKRLAIMASKPVDLDLFFEIQHQLNKITLKAPVMIGDIIIKDCLNQGFDIVSSETLLKIKEE